MCGKATFAIAVSSNSMNVASVTVIAMNQGLMPVLGMGRLSAVTGVNVSLMAMLSTLDAEETVRSHLFYAKIRERDQSVPLPARKYGDAMTKGEQTRRQIVQKAAPLFNRKGYEGTSLSDLMN